MGLFKKVAGGLGAPLVGKVIKGITGQTAAEAARKAGATQAGAIKEGYRLQQRQVAPALRDITTSSLEAERRVGPYMGAGKRALWGMEEALQEPGVQYTPAGYTAPTAEEVGASPAVQFRMEQAQRALEMGAAAKGGLFGGGHQRQLAQYMQGLASQEYESEAERRFREAQLAEQQAQFGAQFGQSQRAQRLAGLQSIAGMGQQTATIASGIRERMGQMKAGIRTGSGAAAASALQAAGQARASGSLAGAQAKQGALGSMMQLAGTIGGAYLGGPAGAAIGGSLAGGGTATRPMPGQYPMQSAAPAYSGWT